MHSDGFTIELTVSTELGAGGRRVAGIGDRLASLLRPTHGPARSRRQRFSRRHRRDTGSIELFSTPAITA